MKPLPFTRVRLKNHHVASTLAEELTAEQAARLIYVVPHYLPRALDYHLDNYSDGL